MRELGSAAGPIGGDGAFPSSEPVIVEEKPICRQALGALVCGCGFRNAEFASTLAQAQARLGQGATPPLLVVDLFSINYDFEGLRRLSASMGPHPTVAIDDRVNPSFAARARAAGVKGYWAKEYDLERFRAALMTVIAGTAYFPEGAADPAVQGRNRTAGGLSARQLAVLKEMAVGKTNREIANALDISPGTVKLHIHAILKLTGARNRTEAALIAGRFLASQP